MFAITKFENVLYDKDGAPLVCYGCSHSLGRGQNGAAYPGKPSGERPCLFCIRNLNQENQLREVQQQSPKFVSPRYDNVPVRNIPADQYIATDRLVRDLPEDAHIIT